MESVKKWLAERAVKKNGLYLHYSPPKSVGSVSGAQLRQWARGGAESRLERAVLAGQGRRLLAEAEAIPLAHHLPALMVKCNGLHNAVERGSLMELQELLEPEYNKRKYIMCTDEAGVGLLHKAIYYDFMDIAEWLVHMYPPIVHQKDSEGRTPLHYAAMCRDEAGAAALLEGAGAARGVRDATGRTPAYYRGPARANLTLPAPVVADMARETRNNPPGGVIKRSNIRIWCHDCDMARLQRIVWDGHGARLLSEVSNQPIVKRFFEAVPYIMNTIRDLHTAVVKNDLENVMKHSSDPIPAVILSSRDTNNMTVFHKAAGLGHGGILRYICERYPQGVNDLDNEGRTPLHYAAAVKDDQHTYNSLVGLGADESVMDNKNKTPAYYINRSQEIDKNLLKVIPEAPRTPSSAYPSNWDWKLLDTEVIVELNKKSRRKGFKQSTENISSNTGTENTENFTNTMKTSSTQELIKDLPELDESSKSTKNDENDKVTDSKESENVEEQKEPETIEEEPEVTEETAEIDATEIGNDESKVEEVKNDNETESEEKNNEEPSDEDQLIEKPAVSDSNEGDKANDNKEHVPDENTDVETNEDKSALDNENNEENENEEKQDSSKNEESEIKNDKNKDEDEIKEDDNIKESSNENADEKPKTPEEQIEGNDNQSVNNVEADKELSPDENGDAQGAGLADAPDAEGNHNKSDDEDDDDVQVQGETQSEYSEFNIADTAEVTNSPGAKRGNQSNGRRTQDSLIEGVINGDVDIDTEDASISQRDESIHGDVLIVDNEIDPEVTELINSVNMEMLAALVLNGEGARLVGRHSSNSELEAFLENVPAYMKKIHKVHMAAREGNIRDLQAALDRRKFAIARDPISPNGATPLHVATIFGKTNIIKYLGGRFPETLSAVDFEGRTALHYAAILPDNGHYYNLLQQLGANSKDLDDNGHSAEEYHRKQNLMSLDQLFSDFGVTEDVVKSMLSDKVPEDHVSSRRLLDAPEAIDTLERCYRLLATSRPSRTPLSASSNKSTPSLVLGRFLRKNIFQSIKGRVTKLDHDLFDVIWPAVKKLPDNKSIIQTIEDEFSGGIIAPDYYVYSVFHEFLTPLIKDIHNLNIQAELKPHPKTDFIRKRRITSSNNSSEPLVELNLDTSDEFVLSGTMECMRNLNGFELPLNLSLSQLKEVERILKAILLQEEFAKCNHQSSPESDQKGGTYYTLNKVLEKPSEVSAMLASSGLLIALCDKEDVEDCVRLHGKHWPIGRGVYVSDDKTIGVWINVHDHLRVVTSTQSDAPGEVGLPFSRLSYIMTYLHTKLEFVWDPIFGYLSSRPTFLGSGIHFSLIVNFPGLAKDVDNLKNLCSVRGLQYRETLSQDIAKVTNYQSLGVTESNCFNDFTLAMSNLLHLEKDLSMQNSAQIASMLSNIFRRKRSSFTGSESSDRFYS